MTSDSFPMGMFSAPAIDEATSDRAWLQAMLDVEAALARAQARAGMIPREVAHTIATACNADRYDPAAIREGAVSSATPVVPLVEALTREVGPGAAPHVHMGATSQDIIDSALMLIAKRCCALILEDIDGAAGRLAGLTQEHRETTMLGRTLMQPALPITFGLKCANWLDGLLDARDAVRHVREQRLAAQLGGPAGNLGGLGESGPRVAELLAGELGLCAAAVPWHTNRSRIVELAAALAMVAGAAGKIAGDVVLLAQAEVGEVTAGRGRSSSMAHKRNPAAAVLTIAASKNAVGYAAMLLGLQVHEHERAAGSWQAEWHPLVLLLRAAGGSAHHLASLLTQLEPHPEAMRRNLNASGVGEKHPAGSEDLLIDRVLDRYERNRRS